MFNCKHVYIHVATHKKYMVYKMYYILKHDILQYAIACYATSTVHIT